MDLKDSFYAVILGALIMLQLGASHNEEGHFQPDLNLSTADNTSSDSAPMNSASWGLLAAALLLLLAFAVTLYFLCKGQCTNSHSRPQEEREKIIPDKLKEENDIEDFRKSQQYKLKEENEELKEENELLDAHVYRADVILDPKTAHPRLEVSEKGKCVRDTGIVSKVSDCEDRFNSQAFILAAEGFSEGKHYWEVEVGQKEKWDLGVASESAPRKGTITLSPENGYWVMGLDGGKNYLARTEVWTRLQVTGKLTKIGIFLDIPARRLSFYDVNSKRKLHTYYTICSSGKFYPFFSVGSVTTVPDSSPLQILPLF
ncbi:butyrophilin subfamily 3 member A1-like isoform X2 [Rhineura floridana]|uniref:butyrophilin subfamily 3 member A1-like isoform X2 n=1 Tax=Rhineura floridana TaxID=261503 RepID=UPI002AC81820|nr:butyrophilin subfamily 3 member A1-like isoform X2 [Rhineura floridana]